ncbi:hypothetical protein HanPSC8_Chr09g0354761 [Helianthus annuus]|nr:hypothetical protein HanPSC8_Chr09g0354761 [Helianthus annuus]
MSFLSLWRWKQGNTTPGVNSSRFIVVHALYWIIYLQDPLPLLPHPLRTTKRKIKLNLLLKIRGIAKHSP